MKLQEIRRFSLKKNFTNFLIDFPSTYIFYPQFHHSGIIFVSLIVLKHGKTLFQRLSKLIFGVQMNVLLQPANVPPPQCQRIGTPIAVDRIFPMSLIIIELMQRLVQIVLILVHFLASNLQEKIQPKFFFSTLNRAPIGRIMCESVWLQPEPIFHTVFRPYLHQFRPTNTQFRCTSAKSTDLYRNFVYFWGKYA